MLKITDNFIIDKSWKWKLIALESIYVRSGIECHFYLELWCGEGLSESRKTFEQKSAFDRSSFWITEPSIEIDTILSVCKIKLQTFSDSDLLDAEVDCVQLNNQTNLSL